LKAKDEAEPGEARSRFGQGRVGNALYGSKIKLPAAQVLGPLGRSVPDAPLPIDAPIDHRTFREIVYSEEDEIGYLWFDFYKGAMSSLQCYRLRDAILHARARPTRVIVLLGGVDFWSNGINLNAIEAGADPGAESWRNINAINDLIFEILNTTSHLVVAGSAEARAASGRRKRQATCKLSHRGTAANVGQLLRTRPRVPRGSPTLCLQRKRAAKTK
jgi:hypothetical protein